MGEINARIRFDLKKEDEIQCGGQNKKDLKRKGPHQRGGGRDLVRVDWITKSPGG